MLFDECDRILLKSFHETAKGSQLNADELLFNSHMHPRGIKELVNTKELRVANSLMYLLNSLESDKVDDRLSALHSLRDEVFFSAESSMNKNTARVLLAVMKDLVRETNDEKRQLELSHDFHSIMTGKPSIVRKFLRQYNLLEMPEEWNQITFDHHVHDSHTKGRKSPTHLIMDAWIKGIRNLTVIYYDLVPPEAAKELLTAAKYMRIKVRIGVEFMTRFRNGPVNLIWVPRGFSDADDFLNFLNRENVKEYSKKGLQASKYRERKVLSILEVFNSTTLSLLNSDYDLSLSPLKEEELRDFVGIGQLSLLHLSEFIYFSVYPEMEKKIGILQKEYHAAGIQRKREIEEYVRRLDKLTSEYIFEHYLKELESDKSLFSSDAELPEIMRCSPPELIKFLGSLHSGYRITLNLTGLTAEDVLELLYICNGRIHNIEIYNYKDFAKGRMSNISEIRELEHCINEQNATKLKRIIQGMIRRLESEDAADADNRVSQFRKILLDINQLFTAYRDRPLHDRWGSDSTGRSNQLFGMGFAIKETLPKKAQKEVELSSKTLPRTIPVFIKTTYQKVYHFRSQKTHASRLPLRFILKKIRTEWIPQEYSSDEGTYNNVIALGGRTPQRKNGFTLESDEKHRRSLRYGWKYLNTSTKNILKILFGFIPAFLTFSLTKDWWVLAYLGAPIWFSITCSRNILQSVIGGDSLHRSPLLRWTHYINWSRIADSLLYTGFSVPLLDYVVKHLILDVGFSINTTTNSFALYAIMSLVNGIYISTHNMVRGLPRTAIIGNFFRSILSIPIALLFNSVIATILSINGVIGIDLILQKWAAVISKAASDLVAGFIEGIGDRKKNIHLREQDYKRKVEQMYSTYSMIELMYLEEDLLELLKNPEDIVQDIEEKSPNLLRIFLYDALDFFYFWMYQPYARTVLRRYIKRMSQEERTAFLRYQNVLKSRRHISNLFIEGIVGEHFEKPLALYLSRSQFYLSTIAALCKAP